MAPGMPDGQPSSTSRHLGTRNRGWRQTLSVETTQRRWWLVCIHIRPHGVVLNTRIGIHPGRGLWHVLQWHIWRIHVMLLVGRRIERSRCRTHVRVVWSQFWPLVCRIHVRCHVWLHEHGCRLPALWLPRHLHGPH